jgi:lipoate-protein ligase A
MIFEELDLILPQESFDGPMQMALDEVLLKRVKRPLLRIYGWEATSASASVCVTFGYFQQFAEVRRTHPSLLLVRRWTGGGMVEHGHDLTFSLMIPKESAEKNCHAAENFSPRSFYRSLHGLLAEGLKKICTSEIHLATEKDLLVGSSCFTAPAQDDLLMEGRKILGGAQRRSAGSLLYQGSLQGMGSLGEKSKRSLLVEAISQPLSSTIFHYTLETELRNEALQLAKSKYSSPAWNERR